MRLRLALDAALGEDRQGVLRDRRRTATAPSDYIEKYGTVTFAPGVVARTVSVAIVGDLAAGADRDLQAAAHRGPERRRSLDGSGRGEIVDDD